MELYKNEDTGLKYMKINASGKLLETPGCLIYSRGGMVPHLTDFNLNTVIKNTYTMYHLPLSTVYEQPGVDVMQKFGGTFHQFSSSEDKVWILNCNDSYVLKPDIYKYNEMNCVSIWAPSGRRKITPEEYMKIVELFSFDVAIAPSDTIPSGLSKKRCHKSMERTAKFLSRCLEIKEEKKLTVPIVGVIEGGDSNVFREKSAMYVASQNVDAYAIGGFDHITSNWKDLLELSIKHLKSDKAKMMFGVLSPMEVIEAVELGVDIFDTVICYDAAERGCALCFPYTKTQNIIQNDIIENTSICKKAKTDKGEGCVQKDLRKFEMDLNDRRYFDECKPLVDGCQCYCCVHHVRAYIHHLLVTKEMLASVLLMMHNLTFWLDFFKEIRKCIQENRLGEMKEILQGIHE